MFYYIKRRTKQQLQLLISAHCRMCVRTRVFVFLCRHHPVHDVALVRLERVQRDVWTGHTNTSEDAEVGSRRVHRGAGADGEVHAARVP